MRNENKLIGVVLGFHDIDIMVTSDDVPFYQKVLYEYVYTSTIKSKFKI